jgi:hypothetical protein
MREPLKKFFDNGGVNEIFLHVRNLMYSTLVFGAGAYTLTYAPKLDIWGIRNVVFVSYGVMAIGVLLLALNLIDGLYRLSKLKYRFILYVFVSVVYLAVSFRFFQIMLAFRLKM